jgi:hypothetical protein
LGEEIGNEEKWQKQEQKQGGVEIHDAASSAII